MHTEIGGGGWETLVTARDLMVAMTSRRRAAFASGIYAGSFDHDTASLLHEITCPVTLGTGSETNPLQRCAVEVLAAQSGTEPVVLPGVDHFGPIRQPKQFADAVARWVIAD